MDKATLRVELDAAFARNAKLFNTTKSKQAAGKEFDVKPMVSTKCEDRAIVAIEFADGDGNEVGTLDWSNGTISFRGNMDRSALLFFSTIENIWDMER